MSATDPSQEANTNPTQPTVDPAAMPIDTAALDAAITDSNAAADAESRRRILIGSQRDPAAYRARQKRDWTPVVEEKSLGEAEAPPPAAPVTAASQDILSPPAKAMPAVTAPPATASVPPVAPAATAVVAPAVVAAEKVQDEALQVAAQAAMPPVDLGVPEMTSRLTGREESQAEEVPARSARPVPAPLAPPPVVRVVDDEPKLLSRRQKLSAEMEDEFAQALGDASFEELMSGSASPGDHAILEPESRHRGRVVAVRRGEVFVELGGREQGVLQAMQFTEPPAPGTMLEVIVRKFHADEGLYDLSLPGASVDVGNWDDVQEGMLVDAQVTGHNTGGLECEVNHLRGFIPVSQIALYRVEDLAQFVGQQLKCLITEANASRRNLVLSCRAVLEREKEENRQKLFDSLEPGQVYEGVVRKLMDFGAFVDLGNGVDGLLHISQLSWGRVNHPKDVLTEGQAIRVKIEKVDRTTGRIGLAYRDMLESPWSSAEAKYPPNTIVKGKVAKLMEFGAFVELEPGIEGLVHISELSHKRVWRASDVVHEGDEIEVMVLNVNTEAQRMSLSIKALSQPEPTKKEKEEAQEPEPESTKKNSSRPSNVPLRGGLGKTAGGEAFGLNW